jgi:acetyl esterase/lipase
MTAGIVHVTKLTPGSDNPSRRVPPSNGLRYAAALREQGGSCAVRVFPEDCHGLTNPRTEFESFVTVAAFLR